ncbi:MAG: DUF3160 domain-containing protein [Calditrichaeota bacterium]|nr:MAG: DUF3160 domain-containing protein [Calditrichota bacterium]
MKFDKIFKGFFVTIFILPMPLQGQTSGNFDIDTYSRVLNENKNMSTAELLGTYAAGNFDARVAAQNQPFYLDSIDAHYKLTAYEKSLFDKNGFVVTQRLQPRTFADAFLNIYYKDLPVFISTDAILHALHMSYDDILKSVEYAILIPELAALMTDFAGQIENLQTKYGTNQSDAMQLALRDLDIYITLTRRLLGEAAPAFYPENQSEINTLLQFVDGQGMQNIALFSSTRREFDFSQFTIRGHYTESEELGRYFQAMIWLGRTEIYLTAPKEDDPRQKPEDIQRQTMLAALIDEMTENKATMAHLQKMENVIRQFVGESDNVTIWQFNELMTECGFASASVFADTNNVRKLQATLKEKSYAGQKILSQILMSNPMDLEKIEPASAFLLLGQRFIIDSYVFSNVVFDRIIFQNTKIKRMLPSSLDALFALGNDAALQLLQPELEDYNYAANLLSLRYLIDSYDDEFWQLSLYNGWLNSIRALNPPLDRSAYPDFMQTAAWWQQKMNTQLASWAQLRHDNLLYAKQSYTGGVGCTYPKAYLEPFPEFYAAVGQFAQNALSVFTTIEFQNSGNKDWIINYFTTLSTTMDSLEIIAQKEFDGTDLHVNEMNYLRKILYDQLAGCAPVYRGWYADLYYSGESGLTKEDRIVADVHTAPTDEFGSFVGWVKHVGTGPLNMAVINTKMPDGHNMAFIGPVMSYYEHVSTNFKRLTDEEWKTVYAEAPSFRPNWTNVYLANEKGETRGAAPMLATDISQNDDEHISLPTEPVLLQNYPNPFNPSTFISFSIPRDLANKHAQLTIHNIRGQLIARLIDEPMPAGYFTAKWDGKNADGSQATTGVYFYQLKIAEHSLSGRMSLVK